MRKLMLEQRKRVEELIANIREEKNGYELGKPWRHSDQALTCVVPVLKTSEDKEREYITITEAQNIEVTDSGNINEAKVKNNEDKPVFVRLGEILAGETQERAVTSSRIIFPGQEVVIPIACIHASKPIQGGATLTFSGVAPGKEYSYIYNTHYHGHANQHDSWNLDTSYTNYADSVLRKHGFAPETPAPSYNLTWSNNTGGFSNSIGWYDSTDDSQWRSTGGGGGTQSSSTPPGGEWFQHDPSFTIRYGEQPSGFCPSIEEAPAFDDLTAKHKEVNEALQDIIKKVPLFDNQIGLALIDPDGFKCLDCYDVKLSYKAVKEALVGKETAAISDKDEENVFEYKPEVAKKKINDVLDNKFEENIVHEDKNAKTITLDLEGYMGEAVLLNSKIIHLVITRKE